VGPVAVACRQVLEAVFHSVMYWPCAGHARLGRSKASQFRSVHRPVAVRSPSLVTLLEAPVPSRAGRPKRDQLHPEEETNVRIAEFSRSLGSTSLGAEFARDALLKERR
jgi:hypothetical protein